MRYKIFTNGKEYKIQRKVSFWKSWEWLDATEHWCNWYGINNPYRFTSKKDIEDFIKRADWRISQDIII